jgi:transporter family protein
MVACMFLILALLALIAFALGDLVYKQGERAGAAPTTFLMYQSIAFTLTAVGVAASQGALGGVSLAAWGYGLLNGGLIYVSLLCLFRALQSNDASTAVPIYRLNFLVTALLSILLLGEAVTALKLLGLALATMSVAIFIARSAEETERERRTSGWLRWLWVALAVITAGVTGVIVRKGTSEGLGPLELLLPQSLIVMVLAIAGATLARAVRPDRASLCWGPATGILQAGGTALLYGALARGEASIAVPLVQLSFVGTAVLAVLLLREELTRAKLIGLGLASLAVLAFALA